MNETIKKEDFNEEPVMYCKHCLSLRILDLGDADTEYCDECGSTDIEQSSIEDWEVLYRSIYGKKFLNK